MLDRKINFYIVNIVCFFLLFSGGAFACSCAIWVMPQCAYYSRSDTAFVGRIIRIEKPSQKQLKETEGMPNQFIYFEIEHPLKNAAAAKIRVSTYYKSSCDYEDIAVGQRWLVFAGKSKSGELFFGRCDGSRAIENKTELKEILAALPPARDKQTIFVHVMDMGGFSPLPESKVTVEGFGQTFESKTGKGYFGFDVPKPGKYKIRIEFPYRTNLSDPFSDQPKKISAGDDKSVFEGEIEAVAGECAFRQLEGSRESAAATFPFEFVFGNLRKKDHFLGSSRFRFAGASFLSPQ